MRSAAVDPQQELQEAGNKDTLPAFETNRTHMRGRETHQRQCVFGAFSVLSAAIQVSSKNSSLETLYSEWLSYCFPLLQLQQSCICDPARSVTLNYFTSR